MALLGLRPRTALTKGIVLSSLDCTTILRLGEGVSDRNAVENGTIDERSVDFEKDRAGEADSTEPMQAESISSNFSFETTSVGSGSEEVVKGEAKAFDRADGR